MDGHEMKNRVQIPSRGVRLTTLTCILLFGAVTRLYNLSLNSMLLDEIYSVRFVVHRTFWRVIADSFEKDFNPFAYYALLDAWSNLFGYSDFSCRMLSVSLGLVSIVWIYKLADLLFPNTRIGMFAAICTAINPMHIYYSQHSRMYILLMTIWPACLYFLARTKLRSDKSPTNMFFLLSTFLLFAYTHASSGFLSLPFLAIVLLLLKEQTWSWKNLVKAKSEWILFGLCTILYVPWIARLMAISAVSKPMFDLNVKELGYLFYWMIFFVQDMTLLSFFLYFGFYSLLLSVVILYVLPAIKKKQHVNSYLILLLSIAVPLLTSIVLTQIKPFHQPRNLCFLFPPFVILVCAVLYFGMLSFKEQKVSSNPRRWAVTSLSSLAAVILLVSMSGFSIEQRHTVLNHNWREATAYLGDHLLDTDGIVFYAAFADICFYHYHYGYGEDATSRPGLSVFKIKREPADMVPQIRRLVDRVQRRAIERIWVVSSHVRDPLVLENRLLQAGFQKSKSWDGVKIRISLFLSPETAQSMTP